MQKQWGMLVLTTTLYAVGASGLPNMPSQVVIFGFDSTRMPMRISLLPMSTHSFGFDMGLIKVNQDKKNGERLHRNITVKIAVRKLTDSTLLLVHLPDMLPADANGTKKWSYAARNPNDRCTRNDGMIAIAERFEMLCPK